MMMGGRTSWWAQRWVDLERAAARESDGSVGQMGDQRFGVTQVVGDVDDLECIQELERGLLPADQFKGHHGAAFFHLALRQFVLGMIIQTRVENSPNTFVIG